LFWQENGVGTNFEQQFFLVHTASSTFRRHSFNVFDFVFSHQIGNLIVYW